MEEKDLVFNFKEDDLNKVRAIEPETQQSEKEAKAAEETVVRTARTSAEEVRQKKLVPTNIAGLRDMTARFAESVMSHKWKWLAGMMVGTGGNITATAMMFGVAASIHGFNKSRMNAVGPKAISKSIKLDKAYESMLKRLGVPNDKVTTMSKEFSHLYDSKVKEQIYDKLTSLYQNETLNTIGKYAEAVKEQGLTTADYEAELCLAKEEYSESMFMEKAHSNDYRAMYKQLLVEGGGYEQLKVDSMMSLYDETPFADRKRMFADEENFQKKNSLFCEDNRKARMEESFMSIVKNNFDNPQACAEQLILQSGSGSCRYDENRPVEFDFKKLSKETQKEAKLAAYLRRMQVMKNIVQNGCSADDVTAFPALARLGNLTDTEKEQDTKEVLKLYDAKKLSHQKEVVKSPVLSMVPNDSTRSLGLVEKSVSETTNGDVKKNSEGIVIPFVQETEFEPFY